MKATADKRRGIRWNFTTVLQNLDLTDDITLLSSTRNYLHEKTGTLAEETARVGLKLNAKKCKTLRPNVLVAARILWWMARSDDVEEFTYLGAIVDKEGGGCRDIMHRLHKAHGAF